MQRCTIAPHRDLTAVVRMTVVLPSENHADIRYIYIYVDHLRHMQLIERVPFAAIDLLKSQLYR